MLSFSCPIVIFWSDMETTLSFSLCPAAMLKPNSTFLPGSISTNASGERLFPIKTMFFEPLVKSMGITLSSWV